MHCSLVGFETHSSLLCLLMVPECSILACRKPLDTLLCFGQHGFRSHKRCSAKPSSLSPTSLQAQDEGRRLPGEHAALTRMQTQPTCSLQATMSMGGGRLVQWHEETVVLEMGGNISSSGICCAPFVVDVVSLLSKSINSL